jgi:hypothetical protein
MAGLFKNKTLDAFFIDTQIKVDRFRFEPSYAYNNNQTMAR